LLPVERRGRMLLEKPGHKLYFGLLAQTEQGPEDCTDRIQGPERTPLHPGSLYEAGGYAKMTKA